MSAAIGVVVEVTARVPSAMREKIVCAVSAASEVRVGRAILV
jgi:hypothetical protein